jgi:hypothetical protein
MSFAASGGTSPYSWSWSGSFPPGLSLSSVGALSGTTTTAGNYNLTVQVADSASNVANKSFSFTVQPASPMPVTASPSSQSVGPALGAAYTIMVTSGAGFSGTVSFTVSGLPSGATWTFSPSTLNSSGTTTLTITPTGNSPTGTFSITVTAQNGSLSHATTIFLTVMAPSAANMLTPGQGAILTGSTGTFTWDSGIGVSQYRLFLGSTPGGSDYYNMNTGSNQAVTASIPNGSPATVYATLGSLISGGWQSRSYNYTAGPPTPNGTPDIAFTSPTAAVHYILNDNQAIVAGPYYSKLCDQNYQNCVPTSAGHVQSCNFLYLYADTGGVTVNSISRPSQYDAADNAFDLNTVSAYSAQPAVRALQCTFDNGQISQKQSGALTVYDATPHITDVIQYPPDYPNGPFWVTLYGTNFGQHGGSVAVCNPGTADPCKDHPTDVTDAFIAPYGFSSDTQINTLMYPAQTAVGPYDVQVTAGGELSSLGFQAAPAGQSKPQSNRGQIQVTPAPQVRISQSTGSGTVDITGQTVNVIVGQQINLTGTVGNSPAGVTIQSQSWSVAGNRVAGYTRSDTEASVTVFKDPATANAVFYWIDGGTNSVTYTVNLSNGNSYSGTAQFTVARPKFLSWNGATTTLSPAINIAAQTNGGPPLMQFGYLIPANEDPKTVYPGIEYNADVKIPTGYAGQLALTQLVNASRTRRRPDGTSLTYSTGGSYVLDTKELYATLNLVEGQEAVARISDDLPGVSLNLGFSSVSVNDRFQAYLEYKPDTPNSIWVTLGVFNWDWSAVANFTDSWTIDTTPAITHYSVNPSGQDSTTLPVWSSNVTSVGYQ